MMGLYNQLTDYPKVVLFRVCELLIPPRYILTLNYFPETIWYFGSDMTCLGHVIWIYFGTFSGWFQTFFPFYKWDVILSIDELIFFKMVKTTNQFWYIFGSSKNQIIWRQLILRNPILTVQR